VLRPAEMGADPSGKLDSVAAFLRVSGIIALQVSGIITLHLCYCFTLTRRSTCPLFFLQANHSHRFYSCKAG
jgi:hypothetical protein